MKNYILLFIVISLLSVTQTAFAQLYSTCPHRGAAGSELALLRWQIKDPSSGAVVSTPQPNTIYQLEIIYTGSTSYYYNNIGIQGTADGFRMWQSVSSVTQFPDSYYTEDQIRIGVGADQAAVATFGIKTYPADDPNWSGQLTAFKAYGLCTENVVAGYPGKFYKKTLTIP